MSDITREELKTLLEKHCQDLPTMLWNLFIVGDVGVGHGGGVDEKKVTEYIANHPNVTAAVRRYGWDYNVID